ncbi:putative short chain dehydrogenase [Coniella lustricola]|uniref:Putative short chain dehydrogenase n=1 Tax=Coniella lustricola TaxID=2025994 RepID=A0A2T3A9R9_9PEZI|nr:putative short chain dehydrogenase [Coniella lustricola]
MSNPSDSTSRLPEFSLQDKVIVVSGAARGLGLVQSEALLEAGAKVYALDRLEEPDADFARVQERAKALGTEFSYTRIDVRDNVAMNATIKQIADENGRMDGLLACAGIQLEKPALEYTMEESDKVLGINVTGVFMTAQAVARQMRRLDCRGSMAFIASMSGTIANKGLFCPAYNASKAAVLQLGRNLAMEWGEYGIRVNTISPGYIITPMTAPLFEEFPDRKEKWSKDNMLGRLSYPEEYRGAAVFLLSDASSFMTGSDLRIDGGHCAW